MDSRVRQFSIYFLNLMISGLLYSFVTGKLLQLEGANKLIILILSSLVDLILIFVLRRTKLIQTLPVSVYSLASLLGLLVWWFFKGSIESIGYYLSLYLYLSILNNSLLLIYQEKILESERSLTSGFFTVQLLRNVSKMFGFFLGILLSQFSSDSIFFYLLLGNFLITYLLTSDRNDKATIVVVRSNKRIGGRIAYILSGILGTAIVVWIPLITKSFVENNLESVSWIPFLLPGLVSIALIQLQKRYMKLYQSIVPEVSAIVLFLIFFYLRFVDLWPMIQAVVFSLLTALLLSIGVKVRTYLLEKNPEIDIKYLLQTMTVNGSLFTFVFSMLGHMEFTMEAGLLLASILVLNYMLWKHELFE